MEVSFFSLIMSIIFFSIGVLIMSFLKKRNNFIISSSISSIMFLAVLSIIRIALNFEFENSIYIESKVIYPKIIDALRSPVYLDSNITVSRVLVIIWMLGSFCMALKSTFLYFKFKNNIDSMSKFQLNKDLLVLKDIKTQLIKIKSEL